MSDFLDDMSIDELLNIIRLAHGDPVQARRIIEVVDLLAEDFQFVTFSHDTFLRAARDYLRDKPNADYQFRAARQRRAALGGSSRVLYQRQEEMFKKVVGLLAPGFLAPAIAGLLWPQIKALEIVALRKARA